jgi:hypothetical protein
MKLVLRLALASLWLAFYAPIQAQTPELSFPFVNNVQPGVNLNLPLTVTGFDSIVSMDMVIRWDPAVLKYLITDNFNLSGLNAGNINATNALDSGFIRVQWEAPNVQTGASIANGTAILRLRVKVIGAVGTSSPVYFTQQGNTPFEIAQINGTGTSIYNLNPTGTPPILDPGFVAVGFTVNTDEASVSSPLEAQIFPNPFADKTEVVFDLKNAAEFQYSLVDAAGRVVFEEKKHGAAGKNSIIIEKTHLPVSGNYFLILRTANQSCVRPISQF